MPNTETVAQVLARILERQRGRGRRGPVEGDELDEEADDSGGPASDTAPPLPEPPAPS